MLTFLPLSFQDLDRAAVTYELVPFYDEVLPSPQAAKQDDLAVDNRPEANLSLDSRVVLLDKHILIPVPVQDGIEGNHKNIL